MDIPGKALEDKNRINIPYSRHQDTVDRCEKKYKRNIKPAPFFSQRSVEANCAETTAAII